jgi:hypothetical protein
MLAPRCIVVLLPVYLAPAAALRVKAAVRFSVINTLLGKRGAARHSRLPTRRGIGNN